MPKGGRFVLFLVCLTFILVVEAAPRPETLVIGGNGADHSNHSTTTRCVVYKERLAKKFSLGCENFLPGPAWLLLSNAVHFLAHLCINLTRNVPRNDAGMVHVYLNSSTK